MRANLGVLFHCLGIDVESGSAGEAFLKKLSKDNGGDFALVAP